MTRIIAAGQTFAFHGTLGAGHTLVADSGSPAYLAGAYIGVHNTAFNQGTIDLFAGPSYRNLDGATGATLRVTGILTNFGLIDVSGGTDASGHRGPVGGAAVKIADTGSLINNGTIVLGGAAPYANGGKHDGRSSGANLRDNGTLTNYGSLLIEGSGYSGHAGGATAVVAGLLTNAGYIDVGSGLGQYGERGGIMRVLATGTLVNDGQFEIGPTADRDTAGRFTPAGAATLQVAGQFSNYGLLDLSEGGGHYGLGAQATIFSTGTLLNSGVIKVDGGAVYSLGRYYTHGTPATLTNDGTLANLGTIDVAGFGNTLLDNGVLTNDGFIEVAAGFENSTYYFREPGYFVVAGTLVNTGNILVDRSISNRTFYDAPGGILSATGTIDNSGTITLQGYVSDGFHYHSGAMLALAGMLTNTGQIVAEGATIQISGVLTNLGTIVCNDAAEPVPGARIRVAAAGLLVDPGSIIGTAQGTLFNAGTLSSGGTGITTGIIQIGIENTGTIEIPTNGGFTIDGPVSQTGQISIGAGGVLTIGSSVGIGQTIDFTGTQSVLALASPAAFYAIVEGLRPGTTIDFLKTGISAAFASGTTLELTLGAGGTLDLKLAAPLAAGDMLVLQSDQHGGTDLTVSLPQGAVALGSGSYGLTGHEAFGTQPSFAGLLTTHPPA